MSHCDCITRNVKFEAGDDGDTIATCLICGSSEKIPAQIGARPKRNGLAARIWENLNRRTINDCTALGNQIAEREREIQRQIDRDMIKLMLAIGFALFAIILVMA